jgi:23S rRNA G2069 N7-methylase RlmK/C1962 C5-methylase RlmI
MKPTIVNADCLEALKGMEGELFDLCLLDPPYFDYKTGHRKDGGDTKLSQSLVQEKTS